jgi:hypothetical protein
VGSEQVTPVEFDDVASGRLCYLLNEGAGQNIYFQTLGEDEHPVLDATHQVVTKNGDTYSNGIEAVRSSLSTAQRAVFDLQGRSHSTMQHGLNIVRQADGQVKKVFVRYAL